MPSFDVVSEVDQHELANAVDHTQREIGNRFDFKGTSAKAELSDGKIIMLLADSDFKSNRSILCFTRNSQRVKLTLPVWMQGKSRIVARGSNRLSR